MKTQHKTGIVLTVLSVALWVAFYFSSTANMHAVSLTESVFLYGLASWVSGFFGTIITIAAFLVWVIGQELDA